MAGRGSRVSSGVRGVPGRVVARAVSFGYSGVVERVLDGVEMVLEPGWYGLVGDNGAGKSTLLSLLAGELEPERGRVEVDGVVVRVPQDAASPTTEVMVFGADEGGEARDLRRSLGLDVEMLGRWAGCADEGRTAGLSAGERRKWLVGAALWCRPDVLLLDEPETHLDQRSRAVLEQVLKAFGGVGIIVAHDRELLDAVTSKTLWLDGGKVRVLDGAVSFAMAVIDEERRAKVHRREVLKGVVENRAAQREAAKRVAQSASVGESTRKRMKDKNDSDARGILHKNLANWAAGTHARRAGLAQAALDEARRELAEVRVEDRLGGEISFEMEPCKRSHVLIFETPELKVGERVLLRDVRVAVARNDKVHLAGDNGSGKSTLLRAMQDSAPIPPERILFVPQEVGADEVAGLRRELGRMAPRERGRVLQIVAALGTEPERITVSERLSHGEAKKLLLAMGIVREVWLLMLDEPENHLDLASVRRLEAALVAWPGALAMVTHDVALANRVAMTRWVLRDGRVAVEAAAVSLG